jgi:sulfinoalanine decarboxylase
VPSVRVPFAQRPQPPPVPSSFFPDPFEPDAALEDFLQRASRLLSRWLGSNLTAAPLPRLSVLPEVEPAAEGLASERLLGDLQLVMEGAFNPNHPGALAHLDPPPLAASIVADMICAGLNNNLLAEELSPSLSHLERRLCAWIARRLGLPAPGGGVAASGGSLSNLMALVVARDRCGPLPPGEGVVVCSEDAHVSLDKAIHVMGLPPRALLRIPVDRGGRMRTDLLAERLERLERQGVPVIAVVATAGTTVRGAVDALPPITALCRRHGHWLHVDGAIGAVFALVPAQSHRLAGLGQADSITVNPQKLLGITKTSSLLLLAEPSLLQRSFATGLPYMEPSWGGGQGGEAGLQGTRPAEILKLWLGLRQLGLAGIENLLAGAIDRRRRLEALLATAPELLIHGGSLHLLAFRPRQADAAVAEQWSQAVRRQLLDQRLLLSRPRYQGHHHLKAVLGNPHTDDAHLQRLATVVQDSLAV